MGTYRHSASARQIGICFAGLDFSGFASMLDGGIGTDEDGSPGRLTESGLTHLGQQVCWVWQEIEVPVIAAIHGHVDHHFRSRRLSAAPAGDRA